MKLNYLLDSLILIFLIIFSWGNSEYLENTLILISIFISFFLSIYVSVIILNRKNLSLIIRKNSLLIVLILWCIISIFYSIDKNEAIRQVISISILTYTGILIAILYDNKNFFRIYSLYIIISILFSILLFIVMPEQANTISYGTVLGFKGVYTHKNILARNMLIGSIILDYYNKISYKKIYTCFKYICYIFIILSKSTTSLIILIIYFIFKKFINKKNYKIPTIILSCYSILVFIAVFFNEILIESKFADFFHNITGKNLQFTGRMDIWDFSFSAWLQNPILGYGYGSFWKNTEFVYNMSYYFGKFPSVYGSHNGYIDILLNLGIIGLLIIISILVKLYINSKKDSHRPIITYILFIILMINCFENYLLGNQLFWLLIVYFINRTYIKSN